MTIQTQLLAASYNEKLNLRVCVYAIPVRARQPVSEAIALAAHRPDENAGTAAVDLEQPRYTPDRSGSGLFWAKTDTEFEPQDTQSKHPSEELIEE